MTSTYLLPCLGALALSLGCVTTLDDGGAGADERAEPISSSAVAVHADRAQPAPTSCAALAARASELLGAAQRCNVAAASPAQCARWVPSIDGCEQPVAAPNSEETRAYLQAYDAYAASCPLPDRPCVDPLVLTVACSQAADVDSLLGRCAILDRP
ncbi:MAG: hypothetical protein KA297_03345 [Kofleriaceae bacterium]|jgi:hypothetical protein|nr:hypothetical protein [Kofleriaceae bacterium]MBP6840944.1 hypothetical protein [Kofleriaceae bacterium]